MELAIGRGFESLQVRMKADIHIHTDRDPIDGLLGKNIVDYSPIMLINEAAKKGFTHISLTHHKKIFFNNALKNYALSKGIFLIPGVEASIEGKDVVLLNPSREIKTFKELLDEKRSNKELFVLAPHPFYPSPSSLNKELIDYIDLFDAIEISFFNHFFVNYFNKKAIKIAKKYDKPLITTSDSHKLENFGHNYIVSKEKDLFKAIKKRDYETVTKKMSFYDLIKSLVNFFLS